MRIKPAIFVGSMAALTSVTAPELAKNSDAQKAALRTGGPPGRINWARFAAEYGDVDDFVVGHALPSRPKRLPGSARFTR